MNQDLNKEDIDTIIESLSISRDKVKDAPNDPTYEEKMKRVQRIEDVLNKVRKLKKDWIG